MQTLSPGSLVLLALCSGCTATSRSSGQATFALAQVDVAPSRIEVRPNELAWRLGERFELASTVTSAEGAGLEAGGGVFLDSAAAGAAVLPAPVEVAATRELIERGSDGMIVTHFTVDTTWTGTVATHEVLVGGRLLHLDDLGPMEPEALSAPVAMPAVQPDAAPEVVARPARAPERPKGSDGLQMGLEVGTTTGITADIDLPGRILDGLGVRVGAQAALLYGYLAFGLPTATVQVELLEEGVVHPFVGGTVSVIAAGADPYWNGDAGVQLAFGAEVDPKGPIELTLGLRTGSVLGSAYVTPDLAVGWLW